MTIRLLVLLALACVGPARAQTEWLDRVDRALSYRSPRGLLRLDLSGRADLEGYYIDQRPPGLIFGGGASFANPRLALFLDAHLGRHLYGFVQTRLDRGFDPRSKTVDARADEYLLRWTPLDRPALNLQAGKFATVVGNWVARHDPWDNPLVNAPLPYENVTTVTDGAIPATPGTFLARRNVPDRKFAWVPIVWGPSYASGVAVFGRLDRVDYAAEMKNAALSARPNVWDVTGRGFEEPTASGRVGVRPTAAWDLGASASVGPYLRQGVEAMLGPGRDTGDFRETVVGVDGRFARRHLELWGELFLARFEVPFARPDLSSRTLDADTLAYYLEARYKLTPRVFAGLRWNQQMFGSVETLRGLEHPWDRDAWRVDGALGYRFDRHLQAKLQYSYTRQVGDLQQGEQLVAAQVSVRF